MFKSILTGFLNSLNLFEPTESCAKVSQTTTCVIRVLVVAAEGVFVKLTRGLVVTSKF